MLQQDVFVREVHRSQVQHAENNQNGAPRGEAEGAEERVQQQPAPVEFDLFVIINRVSA